LAGLIIERIRQTWRKIVYFQDRAYLFASFLTGKERFVNSFITRRRNAEADIKGNDKPKVIVYFPDNNRD
jgi:hypothetical protein